jgi:hypothetical protein
MTTEKPYPDIRHLENLHIVFWLMKDLGWVRDFHWLGLGMLVPTFLVQLLITWRARAHRVELIHNLAVCCWIIANGIWMIGEFYFDDGTRSLATAFFVTGLILIIPYYLFRVVMQVLHRRVEITGFK